jgi:Secretion system C-terminal sorting domain/SprB repeat
LKFLSKKYQLFIAEYLLLTHHRKKRLFMFSRICNCLIISFLAASFASAQTVLLDEKFNNCALPAGWNVQIDGNQAAVWYVGVNQNDDYPGETIDGTCFFMIDDDATGDNSDSFLLSVNSPWFDGSNFSTLQLSMDVHYRDWTDVAETFKIFVEDAAGLHLLQQYDNNNFTGNHIYDAENFKKDLVFVSSGGQMRLVIQYDDAAGFNWWAGFDNVKVVGKAGTNVVLENFDACGKPAGWETVIETGDADWNFGVSQNPKTNPKTMDGTCFAHFDDDFLGETAPFSNVTLKSPWFDGTTFANFTAEMDVIHRYYKEILGIFVENELGELNEITTFSETVGGNNFDEFAHFSFDISAFRSQQMRLVFDYSDGQDWGWWTGIDNVKVWGSGQGHDLCGQAKDVFLNQPCLVDDNRTAIFSGSAANCATKSVGSQWFRFVSPIAGFVKINTNADFNDVVNVYQGTCNALTPPTCNNRDEHGFTGETTYLPVNQGVTYLIRVSGAEETFGVSRGSFCFGVEQVAGEPTSPANDFCQNAQPLAIDGACIAGNNIYGKTEGPAPTRNARSRADIWYKFQTNAATTPLEIGSEADFSDVIAVFSGSCANLTEVISTEFGKKLNFIPTANTNYFVQISGNFATVEGRVCASVKKNVSPPPANDNCLTANVLQLNQPCFSASNLGASFSGLSPNCAYLPTADVWFSFVAPSSGAVKIATGAQFEHVAAVWEGVNCNNLTEIFCQKNPLRCAGYFEVPQLVAGKKYYLQIASFTSSTGHETGQFCVKILDAAQPSDYTPLVLAVEEKCVGQNLAELQISTSGGTQPIDYQGFTNGQTVPSGDDWLVVATDAIGCVQSQTGTADTCAGGIICALGVNLSSNPVGCAFGNNGSATAFSTGGTGIVNFAWNFQNLTTATIQNLPAGFYTVTATDQNGCISSATIQVAEPLPLAISLVGSTPATTGSANGSLQISPSGGTQPFLFSWKNGAALATTEDLENVIGGVWSLVLTDANGCSATYNYTIQEVTETGEITTSVLVGIAPNPTSGKVNLSVQLFDNQLVSYEISDINGRLISRSEAENLTQKTWLLDFSDRLTGVYAVKILVGNAVFNRRIVVVR